MNILIGLLKGLVLGFLAGALGGAGCSMILLSATSRQPVTALGLYVYALWGAFTGTIVGSIAGTVYGAVRPLIPWRPSTGGGRAFEGICIGALIGLGLLVKIDGAAPACFLPLPIAGALFSLVWSWGYRSSAD